MNPADTAAVMLLVMHLLALCVAGIIFLAMLYLHRRQRRLPQVEPATGAAIVDAPGVRPSSWLAIRAVAPETVRASLANRGEFAISGYVNGWVIVSGSGLPSPQDDVDECFRFLLGLSRQLGHVQFFYAEPFSAHHAWARLDEGCVTRAYAWTGETVWHQGQPTVAERNLGLTCFDYGDDSGTEPWMLKETATANVEKIPLLAARWSLDPATLRRSDGITGESSRLY